MGILQCYWGCGCQGEMDSLIHTPCQLVAVVHQFVCQPPIKPNEEATHFKTKMAALVEDAAKSAHVERKNKKKVVRFAYAFE